MENFHHPQKFSYVSLEAILLSPRKPLIPIICRLLCLASLT